MKLCCLTIALMLCTSAPSAFAQTVVDQPNVKAVDVVTKPFSDLNLKKAEVPPILLDAREKPYSLVGLRTCKSIQIEVGRLNAALGDDIDVSIEKTRDEKRGNAVGNVAKSVITAFIPFGGVIREVSGAAANDRQMQVLLYAGASRRAFLKGYGQARGCRYPARAASAGDMLALEKMRAAAAEDNALPPAPTKSPTKKKSRKKR
jgi:hypothetical protein